MKLEWYQELHEVVMIPENDKDNEYLSQFVGGETTEIEFYGYVQVEPSDKSLYISITLVT